MKIKTAHKLQDRKGQPIEITVGEFLAECLWNSRKNQARSYVLAKQFTVEEEVDVKAEDIVFIKEVFNEVGARAGEAGFIIDLMENNHADDKKGQ